MSGKFLRESDWKELLDSRQSLTIPTVVQPDPGSYWNVAAIAPSVLYRLHRRSAQISRQGARDAVAEQFNSVESSPGQIAAAKWALLGVFEVQSDTERLECYFRSPERMKNAMVEALPLVNDAAEVKSLLNYARSLDPHFTLADPIRTFASIYPAVALRWLHSKDGRSLQGSTDGDALRAFIGSVTRTLLAIDPSRFQDIARDDSFGLTMEDWADAAYRADWSFQDIELFANKLSVEQKRNFYSGYGNALASGSPLVLLRFVTEQPNFDLPAGQLRWISRRLLADLPGYFSQYLESRPMNERRSLRDKAFRDLGAWNFESARTLLNTSLGDELPNDLQSKAVEMVAYRDLTTALAMVDRLKPDRQFDLRKSAYIHAGRAKSNSGASISELNAFFSGIPAEYRRAAAADLVKNLALAEPIKAAAMLQESIEVSDEAWLAVLKAADLPSVDLFAIASKRLMADTDPVSYRKIVETLVDRYAQRSIAVAVSAVMDLPEGDARTACLKMAINRWLNLDASGTLDFVTKLPPGAERDSAILTALDGFEYIAQDRTKMVSLVTSESARTSANQKGNSKSGIK